MTMGHYDSCRNPQEYKEYNDMLSKKNKDMNKKQVKSNRRSKQNQRNKEKAIKSLTIEHADFLRWEIADALDEFIPNVLSAKFETALDELQSAIEIYTNDLIKDYKDIEEEFDEDTL